MMISNNQTPSSVEKFTSTHTKSQDPIHYFFIERYSQSYRDQFYDFIKNINLKSKPSVIFEDGRNALILANAAYESLETDKSVKVNFG